MVVVGSLITWSGAAGILGVVEEVEGQRRVVVLFDDGERRTLTIETVESKLYSIGDRVRTVDNQLGFVRSSSERNGLNWYEVETLESSRILAETHLRPHADTDPAALLAAGKLSSPHDFQVRTMAARALFSHESDPLSTLGNARVELREHQVGVLHRVATSYPHRFLLADEVGLGKTIEAGLILKELKARRMADRVLIIVPAGLRRQWQFEMLNKFNERFAIFTTQTVRYLTDQGSTNPWRENSHVICSHDFAARPETRHMEIAQAGWDLIIIDEAHHARRNSNNTTLLYRFAQKLTDPELDRDQSMLLLTATPMQLEREELYALIELLDPALFPSEESFSRHVDELPGLNALVERVRRYGQLSEGEKDEVCSETVDYLDMELPTALALLGEGSGRETVARELEGLHRLSDVMLRNRKAVVGGFMGRHAETIWVDLTDKERAFYDAVTDYTRLGFAASRRRRRPGSRSSTASAAPTTRATSARTR